MASDARLHSQPDLIRFVHDGVTCVLYPCRCIATPFEDREQAKDFVFKLLEVVFLMGSGYTNRDISAQLNITPNTVKSHVIHIFNKLGVGHRTQVVAWAVRQGLL